MVLFFSSGNYVLFRAIQLSSEYSHNYCGSYHNESQIGSMRQTHTHTHRTQNASTALSQKPLWERTMQKQGNDYEKRIIRPRYR